MRRTLIAAISLCLPSLLAAAPPLIDNEGYAYLSDSLLGSRATDQRLQVRSVKWSPRSEAPTSGRVTGIATDPAEPNARGHSMLGASDKVTVGGAQTESGQATGKRQHMPLRARIYYDQPQGGGPGELVVAGSLPGCAVGKRYGGMQFAASGKRYELKDVVISNCSTAAGPKEEITFVYGTVKVRGWDPKKKEE